MSQLGGIDIDGAVMMRSVAQYVKKMPASIFIRHKKYNINIISVIGALMIYNSPSHCIATEISIIV